MPDDATSVAAQAQAAANDLIRDLQAAVAAPVTTVPVADDVARLGGQAVARIAQAAEDAYWTPRRQLEQAIAARTSASARVNAADERIAQLKQQIGA